MDNTENTLIGWEDVVKILNFWGPLQSDQTELRPAEISVYQTAFVHREYLNATLPDHRQRSTAPCLFTDASNERLEFLGDSILKAVIGSYLYRRYPRKQEGDLTRLKIKLEQRATLANFARTLGFSKFIMIPRQLEDTLDRNRSASDWLEDCFEAFVGAVYLDHGIVTAMKFVQRCLEECIDFADLLVLNDNAKGTLQEKWHSHMGAMITPRYMQLRGSGGSLMVAVVKASEIATFSAEVRHRITALTREVSRKHNMRRDLFVIGKSRTHLESKAAEQSAAACALELLWNIH